MQDSSTGPISVLQFRQDRQAKLRDGVRRAIETVLEEELLAALGARRPCPHADAAGLPTRDDRAHADDP